MSLTCSTHLRESRSLLLSLIPVEGPSHLYRLKSRRPADAQGLYSVVYAVSFAKDSNELSSLFNAASLRRNLTRLLLSSKRVKRFPYIYKNLRYLPTPIGRRLAPEGVRDMAVLSAVSHYH